MKVQKEKFHKSKKFKRTNFLEIRGPESKPLGILLAIKTLKKLDI